MGFNLYLAGGDSVPIELTKEDSVGILTTFADGPTAVKKFIEKRNCKVFCDSGAYGAAHSGKVIDLDQYIDFINTTPECETFAVLDEIPWPARDSSAAKISAENTWKNYCYMLERVKPEYLDKLVCAFHYGEEEEHLYRIISGYKGYKPKYIAFGGRAGVTTKELYNYFDNHFWKWVRNSENPNIKIHAFGVTVFDMIEKYSWYSADSTTWLRTGIAGNIHSRYFPRSVINISDRQEGIGKDNHLFHKDKIIQDKIIEEIESRGFTLQELMNDYKKRHEWNCLYYKDWADNFQPKPSQRLVKRSLLAH